MSQLSLMLCFTLFCLALFVVLLVMAVALLCFPIFACAATPIRLIAYILGSVYCDL